MWKLDNTGNEELLQDIAKRFEKKEVTTFPEECPICHTRNTHLYYNRFKENRGGIWVWCSHCRYYIHGSLLVPDWWLNSIEISQEDLAVEPDILEKNRDIIDAHVNKIIATENSN